MMPMPSSKGRDQRSTIYIYIERQFNMRIILLKLERNKMKTWWFPWFNHPRLENFGFSIRVLGDLFCEF
ncbi:hypothetical protein RHMOL_Rhmol09G0061100 [Rhododendron molle]|uniref:Uncharacterized protein n=1 Tax=Rhododendron molle TaxID=49168 RepID=A0ACC0MAJ8_RHOML|nr:hypothetical protein RHMOL_Rhmol09G0061100 [Rhododendron molle]